MRKTGVDKRRGVMNMAAQLDPATLVRPSPAEEVEDKVRASVQLQTAKRQRWVNMIEAQGEVEANQDAIIFPSSIQEPESAPSSATANSTMKTVWRNLIKPISSGIASGPSPQDNTVENRKHSDRTHPAHIHRRLIALQLIFRDADHARVAPCLWESASLMPALKALCKQLPATGGGRSLRQ